MTTLTKLPDDHNDQMIILARGPYDHIDQMLNSLFRFSDPFVHYLDHF